MSTSPKWEYKVLTVGQTGQIAEELNKLGTHGWELVSVVSKQGLNECFWHTLYLKRPVLV